MKITICQLSDNEIEFAEDWKSLKTHLSQNQTDLLLLPEMPFCKWVASTKTVNEAVKADSVQKHEKWMAAVEDLEVQYVVYSKPVIESDQYFNTAFVYQQGIGHQKIHTKAFFPEEPHFWEESWYDREANPSFDVVDLGDIKIGILLCTEMWFNEYARKYGKQGIDLLLCPRATGEGSINHWTRCGQTLAVISGAYCLSSNKSGTGDDDFEWGGTSFIAEPMTGNLLGTTSENEKFITCEIDLNKSREAKSDYPLYVKE
ncbi:carbon-nitrogen hydrolase family protein [Mucilaginibacter aquaedulcis]|uniref:carbon-nitrogen hydrolase family protein n=1 Tax=Mucilaginibacter aquaedulcis TaxID=1187081 RepID=UPI0025B4449E|nr:carbon-nitrogen hydrolase family protein [Mucilaginibacter aquaedulcis]MDN3551430.1 carbon-nitrogen hydrolase family protein [Mucilaginibacter aquaedulcis]